MAAYHCDNCGDLYEPEGPETSESFCCPKCRINLPGESPEADIIAAMAKVAASSTTHRSMGMQMAREILRLKAHVQQLKQRIAGRDASIKTGQRLLTEARAEVDRLRLKAGQQQARNAVFMQAMAWLARMGYQDRAKRYVEQADKAAADVRPEDFVRAKV